MGLGSIFKYFWLLLLCLCTVSAGAIHPSKEARKAVEPYLLPANSSIKPTLDHLFSQSRATFNLKTLKKAGFIHTKLQKYTRLIVTKHPRLKGYIFKLYLDTQRHRKVREHQLWIERIQGAEKVRQEIAKDRLQALFKVPHKWIYALPEQPTPPKGYYPKHYILVEEDMDLISSHANKKKWKSNAISRTFLKKLYKILKNVGLEDCAKPSNIPFAKDGRIAFVDTQTFGSKDVHYYNLLPYLSSSNKKYWKNLYN